MAHPLMSATMLIVIGMSTLAFWLGGVRWAGRNKGLQSSLDATQSDNDRLLAEIDERFKENMQMVISLTNLERRRVDNGLTTSRQAFDDLQGRFVTMATVQRALTHRSSVGTVSASPVLDDIVLQQLKHDHSSLEICVETNQLELDVMIVGPLGLIVHEICGQAAADANGVTDCRVDLNLGQSHGSQTLEFTAHCAEGFAVSNDSSRALSNDIVEMLSDQIGGTLLHRRNGPQVHWSIRYATG